MSKKVYHSVGMLGLLLLAVMAFATLPGNVEAADATWHAAYYNNMTLSGTPVVERQANNINYNWGEDAPWPGVNADRFSIRWTRTVDLPAGNYRFSATMDDGMRVWVDGALIIDAWRDSQQHTVTADRQLSAGEHTFKVEYYENGKNAVARFSWQLAPVTIRNWRGQYFNNMSLGGQPVAVRDDANINFNWGMGSPLADLIPNDRFSVRWTRNIETGGAGRYRFSVTADDGVRLWVNNSLVIDQWHNQPATTHWADVDLPTGSIPVKMEYYENGGDALAFLSWTPLSAPAPVTINNWRGEYFGNTTLSGIPRLVRDDANIAFNWGDGPPASGFDRDNFSARWTRNIILPPGQYRFTVRTDDGVRLWVNDRLIVDQWHAHTVQSYSGEITLYGGPVPVKMEYFERTGLAEAHLSWTQLTSPPTGGPGTGTATVTAYALNFRSGPGTEHNAIGALGRGTVVNLMGYRSADSNWIMVARADGTRGWVHAAYVQTSVPVSSLIVWNGQSGGPGTQPGTVTATVTAYHLNVRSGPGTNYNILTVASLGSRLTLTHRNAEANWVRATLTNGTQGWVHAAYIQSSARISTLPVWSN